MTSTRGLPWGCARTVSHVPGSARKSRTTRSTSIVPSSGRASPQPAHSAARIEAVLRRIIPARILAAAVAHLFQGEHDPLRAAQQDRAPRGELPVEVRDLRLQVLRRAVVRQELGSALAALGDELLADRPPARSLARARA